MANTSAFASPNPFANSSNNSNNAGQGWFPPFASSPAAEMSMSLVPLPTQTRDARLVSISMDTTGNISVRGSTQKRPLVIDDDDDDRKMPAAKRCRRTSSTGSTDSFWEDLEDLDDDFLNQEGEEEQYSKVRQLQEEEERKARQEEEEERKQREHAAMYETPAGRAFKLVECMIQDVHPHRYDLTLIGQDEMVFLAEKLIACQDVFRGTARPTHVSLAYHYTYKKNLQSIREGGLMSHPERQSSNIRTKRGAYFGDGIYTGNNPYSFKGMGDTGLLVAILRGNEQRVGPGGTQDPYVNTVIGNKKLDGNPATDEIILLQSCQVLPILQYNRNMVDDHGRLEHNNGNTHLWLCHVQVQRILDEFFNGGVPTALERITAFGIVGGWPAPTPVAMGGSTPSQQMLQPPTGNPAPTTNTAGAAINPNVFFTAASTNALLSNTAPSTTTLKPTPTNAISIQARSPQVATTLVSPTPLSQVGGGTTASEKEARQRKERFLMFTRVLMKYLENKDPALHARVKAIIKECAERNKRQEPGYESVTASMRERLKHVVGDAYWKRAESYLEHFLSQKQKQKQTSASTTGGLVGPVAASTAAANTHPHNTNAVNNNPVTAAPVWASLQTTSVAAGTASSTQTPDNLSQKQKFLLEYLEFYHPNLYREAVIVRSGCIKRHERKEPGYETLEPRVQEAILQVVGNDIWQKATAHADIKMALLPSQNISFASLHATIVVPSIASGTVWPPTAVPTAFPTVQSETISYTAPASLATAASCTRRIRTLEKCEDCCICQHNLQLKGKVLQLTSCGHLFHQQCITTSLQHDSRCPRCRALATGVPQGKCPSGTMSISHDWRSCGGYENDSNGSIAIRYALPAGVALVYHETPGKSYTATNRVAYLPNNTEGRNLLVRLKYAWSKGLLFSIGTSLTTGKSGQIVWSSVHQKTSLKGGVHGWPDVNYFANVAAELYSLGVPSHAEILGAQTSVTTMQGTAGP